MPAETDLLDSVLAQLQPLGFEYIARRATDGLLEFHRLAPDARTIVVQFQVRHSAPESFTVNLLRVNGERCGARLSTVLWYVYDLREYPASDYWWPTTGAAVRDAVEKVVQYGVPWIEDRHAPKPWEMPAYSGREFAAAVEQVLTPTLQQYGFRVARQHLSGDMPYVYFISDLPDGTHGCVELQRVYSLDPHEFQFDVRLQRRVDDQPLMLAAQPGVSLAQLVWRANGIAVDTATIGEAKTLLWHYADRAELDARLYDALRQIEQIGLPWIAQAGI